MSIVIVDIDHFKRVNDMHGHPVGDELLARLGETLQSQTRDGEIAARVGGEEFVLLLPRVSTDEAVVAAERIRDSIKQVRVAAAGGCEVSVNSSAGVACTGDHAGQDAKALYVLADRALYRAKQEGRNKVVTA